MAYSSAFLRWSQIAAQLPGRTDNEIKNLWNSWLKEETQAKRYRPCTHKPLSEIAAQKKLSGLSHLHNPMLMLAAVQNQAHESLCNQIKPATHLVPDALGAILPHSKQQVPSQTSSIFSKDIQKLTAGI
ncbi:SANT/Myb domain [Sesbania bispinosa]|nr:SANT/Myb domain [Sesbania bispinosa]